MTMAWSPLRVTSRYHQQWLLVPLFATDTLKPSTKPARNFITGFDSHWIRRFRNYAAGKWEIKRSKYIFYRANSYSLLVFLSSVTLQEFLQSLNIDIEWRKTVEWWYHDYRRISNSTFRYILAWFIHIHASSICNLYNNWQFRDSQSTVRQLSRIIRIRESKSARDRTSRKQDEALRDECVNVVYLLVELDPGEVTLVVGVLEAEEPYLAQSNGLHDLVEQLLAGGRVLDRKFQLGIHRRHPHVHLRGGTCNKTTPSNRAQVKCIIRTRLITLTL